MCKVDISFLVRSFYASKSWEVPGAVFMHTARVLRKCKATISSWDYLMQQVRPLSWWNRKSKGCTEHQDESDGSRVWGERNQDQALASQWAAGEHMQLGWQKEQITGDDMGIQWVVCSGQSFASRSVHDSVIQRTSQKVTQAWGHRGKQRVALYGQRIRAIKTY